MVKSKQRSAFTMIELIFAIVIISISMLSLPMLMRVDASNQEGALFQEGILLTTTKVAQSLAFPWDPQSSPDAAATLMSTSQVLGTRVGEPAGLGRNGTSDFRIGHFQEQLRRRLTPASDDRNASAIGAGVNSISSLDGNSETIAGGTTQYAYKKSWRLDTEVRYVTDATDYSQTAIIFDFNPNSAGAITNIKIVEVTATDITPGSAGNRVVLSSFSSNIGEAEFYKRRY